MVYRLQYSVVLVTTRPNSNVLNNLMEEEVAVVEGSYLVSLTVLGFLSLSK